MNAAGEEIGRHRGIHGFTVGQRRGLGLTSPRPLYVLRVRPEERTVVVGDEEALLGHRLVARDVNWISVAGPADAPRAQVQIRYRHAPALATLRPLGGGRVEVVPTAHYFMGGVVVDVDATFQGSEAWYEQVARSRPPKDQPWYRVLVDGGEQGFGLQVAAAEAVTARVQARHVAGPEGRIFRIRRFLPPPNRRVFEALGHYRTDLPHQRQILRQRLIGAVMIISAFVLLFDEKGRFDQPISYGEDTDRAMTKIRRLVAG